MSLLQRICEEPPFRLASYFLVKRFASSVRTLDKWGAVERPHYLAGVLAAADQALRQEINHISVYEFGVAGGSGLVALQTYAEMVERDTGVKISVYGFDTGEGLPEMYEDFRDHPDQWKPADYKMDVPALRAKLAKRTDLRLGLIRDTLPKFLQENYAPIGFVSCDVDLYSSSLDVLKLLSTPGARKLYRVFMYFDDVDFAFNHRFAGELLAIDEFNRDNPSIKIDVWRGLMRGRVFMDQRWLERMYVAHDLEAISNCVLSRAPSQGCQLV
jgi:hypothetical protein